MLVLMRYPDEGILVGDSIRIVVVEVRGQQVKLGIQAPRDVRIVREEIAKPEDTDQ